MVREVFGLHDNPERREIEAEVFMIAVSMLGSEKKKDVEEYPFFGTWRIEKVAVISEMYTGTILDGVAEEDLYDSEDFLGYELEYTPQYFRIGDEKYDMILYP